MSDPELVSVALRSKDDGNLKFKEGKLKEAEGLYRDGLSHLETVKNDNDEIKKLKVVLNQNLAMVLNKAGNYADAYTCCSAAIKVDDKALKAYYQRAVAGKHLKNYDGATEDLKTAIKLNPKDKNLRAEFESLKAEKKKYGAS